MKVLALLFFILGSVFGMAGIDMSLLRFDEVGLLEVSIIKDEEIDEKVSTITKAITEQWHETEKRSISAQGKVFANPIFILKMKTGKAIHYYTISANTNEVYVSKSIDKKGRKIYLGILWKFERDAENKNFNAEKMSLRLNLQVMAVGLIRGLEEEVNNP